jgi:hypothetical protein
MPESTTESQWRVEAIEESLREIEALLSRIPDGPWFVAGDKAEECGPHRNSGLALVDTGRGSDWSIARLCEWHTADFIAQSRTIVPALISRVRRLEAALVTIRDGSDNQFICDCEHDNENCCVIVKEHCPFCIAAVALKELKSL